MFFAFILISVSSNEHFCNHDFIQKQTNAEAVSFQNTRSIRKQSLSNKRNPIRIHLDFRIDDDEYQCVNPGQQVVWQGYKFTCLENDIFNETQKSYL